MINMPSIVVVDDNQEELNNIQNAFFSAGIPCLPIRYISDHENSGIDHLAIDHINPRIIVTDINLQEQPGAKAVNLVGPIAELLKKLVKTGPYALFFWSKHDLLVDEIMILLEQRFFNELNLPMHYGCIEKSKFSRPEKSEELKEHVKGLVAENKLFNAIFSWEQRVSNAAGEALSSLYKLTRPLTLGNNQRYTNLHISEMEKTLAIIGNQTLGEKNAKDYPSEALDSGLAPVVYDRLRVMSTTNDTWKGAIPELGVKLKTPDAMKAALNSFYHVETVGEDFSKSCRGVFVELNPETRHSSKFHKKLGIDVNTLINEEFIKVLTTKNTQDDVARNAKVRDDIILGFIEISAECDQAQRKTKLHRYALAALIPIEHVGAAKGEAHDGIYRLPEVLIDNKKYVVKISFKYQIGTKPETMVSEERYINKWLGNPKFRLRNQILSEIAFRSAQYSSRPGIIGFY